jgi:hypothetical protein
MRSSRANSSIRETALSSIESDIDENEIADRGRIHSSHSGDFLDREPVFDSGGSSDSESDLAPDKSTRTRSPVSVVWQNLTVVRFSNASSYSACTRGWLGKDIAPRDLLRGPFRLVDEVSSLGDQQRFELSAGVVCAG